MTYNKKNKKILLTGGGTGGSVAPVLAVAEILEENDDFEFLWIGTRNGLEHDMVEHANIKFLSIFSGKLRRYFSFWNFIDPFCVVIGFIQAFFIILKSRPKAIVSAGSFVSVPVVWAAWLLRVPVLIHQQDARPGLANKLMAPFAKVITVVFKKSLKDYGEKAAWTGNPIRRELRITNKELQVKNARERIGFKAGIPVILILGGGTGALAVNELVWQGLDELIKFCQIIHIIGKYKGGLDVSMEAKLPSEQPEDYQSFEFLDIDDLAAAYAAADVAVSRCGLGTLTELSYLGKPAILIPMPGTHQEDNAEIFKKAKAAVVLNQRQLTGESLANKIKEVLESNKLRQELSKNISGVIKRGACKTIAEMVLGIVN